MKTMTIRSITADLAAALEKERGRRATSLNRTVLALLRERLGLERKGPRSNGLGELAGGWSAEELEEFEQASLTEADEGVGAEDGNIESLGLSLSKVSSDVRQRFDLEESVDGVVVTEVEDDSVAARKGLRPGDVIVEVGQEEVASPDDVVKKVSKAKEDGRKSVLLLVDRQGDLRFVALRIDQS